MGRTPRRWWWVDARLLAAVAGLWLAIPGSALAEDQATRRAVALADAARIAHARGEYDFAVQAYEQAHALARQPRLLFSIAESYRQRYEAAGVPYDLMRAVEHYRGYLQAAPGGARREEAERALSALAPDAAAIAADDEQMDRVAPSPTRLSVLSNALGAEARIDGGPSRPVPVFAVVAPGKHTISVRASGYVQEDRVIAVGEGAVYPAVVDLEPLPAELSVEGPRGASVRIDGTFVGALPLAKPIELDPGSHRIEVVMSGHEPFARRLELARGKEAKVAVDLEQTTQRVAAWYLIGAGGVAVGTGVAFGVASVIKHREGRDIVQRAPDGTDLDPEEQRAYDSAVDARDDFRIGSGIAAGTGLGLFLLGGALFAFDGPEPVEGDSGASAKPLLGPGLAGGEVILHF